MRKSVLLALGLVVTILVSLGLIVLSSVGEMNGIRLYNDSYFFIKRQAIYVGAGVVIAVLVALIDYRFWRKCSWLTWLFYFGVLALLCVVFLFPATKGSHRWINLGPANLQPSEFAKLAVVVFLSNWIDASGWKIERWIRGLWLPLFWLLLLAAPVSLEPDFGSTMVILSAGFLLMFVGGSKVVPLLSMGALGAGGLVTMVLLNPNRVARLFDEDKLYQVKASLVAIANGGIGGAGLGESMQKYYYLPEAHTDMIFAIGAEELGLFFSIGVIVLFFLLFILSVYIARKAVDRFGRLLVVGMGFIIFFQAMFNIGVVCKALPTKGMALPFFSYGGTNMLCMFFAVGTILSVGIHSRREAKRCCRV